MVNFKTMPWSGSWFRSEITCAAALSPSCLLYWMVVTMWQYSESSFPSPGWTWPRSASVRIRHKYPAERRCLQSAHFLYIGRQTWQQSKSTEKCQVPYKKKTSARWFCASRDCRVVAKGKLRGLFLLLLLHLSCTISASAKMWTAYFSPRSCLVLISA